MDPGTYTMIADGYAPVGTIKKKRGAFRNSPSDWTLTYTTDPPSNDPKVRTMLLLLLVLLPLFLLLLLLVLLLLLLTSRATPPDHPVQPSVLGDALSAAGGAALRCGLRAARRHPSGDPPAARREL